MNISDLPAGLIDLMRQGCAIPAHPLALDAERRLDERHQRALTRYYIDAGAGGIAVGVHTTQFEIRDPEVGLLEPVLEMASTTADEWCAESGRPFIKIAGICGNTRQAIAEAELAQRLGYHAGLLSLSALKKAPVDELLTHCRRVAQVMPVVGFYLQPAVGGRVLPYAFWRQFAEIENVLAIKTAPFNRYQTLDVVRGVCDAGREHEVVLYTGNDDNILVDLLTEYRFPSKTGEKSERCVRIVGGLLGHWAVWTRRAVEQLEAAHELVRDAAAIPPEVLTLAAQITDANAALFDAANGYAGCIPGVHEVLRRQGLMAGTWCLRPDECLSPGQSEALDRIQAIYPHLNDDAFVAEHLDVWLAD